MGLFNKKTKWQRAAELVTDRVDGKALARSGVTAAVSTAGALGVTAVSAIVSARRRRHDT